MTIENIDGFKIIRHKEGSILLIESDRLDEYLHYAVAKNITKISIQGYHGYKLGNVDFLKTFNFFTRISVVTDLSEIDISAVHYLKKAEYISLSNDKQGIDFSCFPELEDASVNWNNKLVNLNACKKLKRLVLWKYKPKSKSFMELKGLDALKSLEVTQSNVESFAGIEYLHHLNDFEGYYLSKLESLKGIEALSKILEALILDNCKNLMNYGYQLGKLLVLRKLILGNCGELNDIRFVNEMPNLEFFSFVDTNVKDGNLNILQEKKFEYIGFNDKKHYSHKMKEINSSFSWKASNK